MHSRYANKIDSNQREIVDGLRKYGASVICVNKEVDLIVGFGGANYLFEIKSAGGKLTAYQQKLHSDFQGKIHLVFSLEQAIHVIEHDLI